MEWPLDEHTDSCLRCRGQVTLPLDTLVELLLRAASGEPVDQLRRAVREMRVPGTTDEIWALAAKDAAGGGVTCRRRPRLGGRGGRT